MKRSIWLGVLLVACTGKKADKPPEAAKDGAAAVAAKDAGAKDGGAAAEQKKAVLPRDQVDAIMKKWLEAQNSGDFAAYSALYDDAFHGVRRSGKQKVELDRKGWLADRKKMFAKPMLVGMRDVEVTLAPTKASVRFTQEWSSGSYHDLGPKVIDVESRAGALLITGEEMLISRLVKPAKIAAGALPPVLPTLDRTTIVLTGDVEARWGSGAPRLIAGEIPDRDPSCDDDPPDYEQDQTRYWECQASDLNGGYAHFVAEQDVDVAALPAPLAAWVGKSVRLSGVGAGCTATVNRLQLRAERETTFRSVIGKDPDDKDAIAKEVMKSGEPALVAIVPTGCDSKWAQAADAPAATPWTIAEAPEPIADAVRAKLRADGDEPDAYTIQTITGGPDKKMLAVAWFQDPCEPASGHVLYAIENGKVAGDAKMNDTDVGRLDAAIDGDGDGWPELVFDDGVAVRDQDGDYQRLRFVLFPDEIANCGD